MLRFLNDFKEFIYHLKNLLKIFKKNGKNKTIIEKITQKNKKGKQINANIFWI